MKRIDKLILDFERNFIEHGIDKETMLNIIQNIINADITRGKYSRFLIECFLNQKFLLEDLHGGLTSTIGQTITLFHKYKNRLPADMRSVFKYESPGDLWNAVKAYDGQITRNEEKKGDREKAYAESDIIEKRDDGFLIISPKTEFAAKWFGRGTRWCTAAHNNNMFTYYSDSAPLFIFILPDGTKLQAWKHKKDIQFMDVADIPVDREYVLQNEQYFKDFVYQHNLFTYKKLEDIEDTRDKCALLLDHPEELNSLTNSDFNNEIIQKHIIKFINTIHSGTQPRRDQYGQPGDFLSFLNNVNNVEFKYKCLDIVTDTKYKTKYSRIPYIKIYHYNNTSGYKDFLYDYYLPKFYNRAKNLHPVFGNKFSLKNDADMKHFLLCYPDNYSSLKRMLSRNVIYFMERNIESGNTGYQHIKHNSLWEKLYNCKEKITPTYKLPENLNAINPFSLIEQEEGKETEESPETIFFNSVLMPKISDEFTKRNMPFSYQDFRSHSLDDIFNGTSEEKITILCDINNIFSDIMRTVFFNSNVSCSPQSMYYRLEHENVVINRNTLLDHYPALALIGMNQHSCIKAMMDILYDPTSDVLKNEILLFQNNLDKFSDNPCVTLSDIKASTDFLELLVKTNVSSKHIIKIVTKLPFLLDMLSRPSLMKPFNKMKQSNKMCEAVIRQNPMALRYVEPCNRSKNICDIAVKGNPLAVIHVPETIRRKKYQQIFNDIIV